MIFRYTSHPKGLNPFQASKAWHLRVQEGLPWKRVRAMVRTVSGDPPGQDAVEDAVRRVDMQQQTPEFQKTGVAQLGYANCGRPSLLSPSQKRSVVDFVKRWRSKRFCTANYIINELKLACKKKTVHRVSGRKCGASADPGERIVAWASSRRTRPTGNPGPSGIQGAVRPWTNPTGRETRFGLEPITGAPMVLACPAGVCAALWPVRDSCEAHMLQSCKGVQRCVASS